VTTDRDATGKPSSGRVLHARSNRASDLAPLIPAILEALAGAKSGSVAHVGV
jgi:hypothetical protein